MADIKELLNIPYRELTHGQYSYIMKYYDAVQSGTKPMPDLTLAFKNVPAITDDGVVEFKMLPIGDERRLPFIFVTRGRTLLPDRYANASAGSYLSACYKYLREDPMVRGDKAAVAYIERLPAILEKMKRRKAEPAVESESIPPVPATPTVPEPMNPVDACTEALRIMYDRVLPSKSTLTDAEWEMFTCVAKSVYSGAKIPGNPAFLHSSERTVMQRILKDKAQAVHSDEELEKLIIRTAFGKVYTTAANTLPLERLSTMYASKVLVDAIKNGTVTEMDIDVDSLVKLTRTIATESDLLEILIDQYCGLIPKDKSLASLRRIYVECTLNAMVNNGNDFQLHLSPDATEKLRGDLLNPGNFEGSADKVSEIAMLRDILEKDYAAIVNIGADDAYVKRRYIECVLDKLASSNPDMKFDFSKSAQEIIVNTLLNSERTAFVLLDRACRRLYNKPVKEFTEQPEITKQYVYDLLAGMGYKLRGNLNNSLLNELSVIKYLKEEKGLDIDSLDDLMSKKKSNQPELKGEEVMTGTLDDIITKYCKDENIPMECTIEQLVHAINYYCDSVPPTLVDYAKKYIEDNPDFDPEITVEHLVDGIPVKDSKIITACALIEDMIPDKHIKKITTDTIGGRCDRNTEAAYYAIAEDIMKNIKQRKEIDDVTCEWVIDLIRSQLGNYDKNVLTPEQFKKTIACGVLDSLNTEYCNPAFIRAIRNCITGDDDEETVLPTEEQPERKEYIDVAHSACDHIIRSVREIYNKDDSYDVKVALSKLCFTVLRIYAWSPSKPQDLKDIIQYVEESKGKTNEAGVAILDEAIRRLSVNLE